MYWRDIHISCERSCDTKNKMVGMYFSGIEVGCLFHFISGTWYHLKANVSRICYRERERKRERSQIKWLYNQTLNMFWETINWINYSIFFVNEHGSICVNRSSLIYKCQALLDQILFLLWETFFFYWLVITGICNWHEYMHVTLKIAEKKFDTYCIWIPISH